MKQLLSKHNDANLRMLLKRSYIKTYKIFDTNNNIVEQWEKNAKGHWIDVTERVKAEQELFAAQQELATLSRR